MSVYFVTWKTCVIDGENTEGTLFDEVEDGISIAEWIDKQEEWIDIAEESAPIRRGGDVFITGVFKL